MWRRGLAACAALVVSSCGLYVDSTGSSGTSQPRSAPSGAGEPTATTTGGPVISGTGMEGPAPYRLRYEGHELVLRPYSWCFQSGCVDGFSQNPPPVGDPPRVWVFVPFDDGKLTANFTPAGERCGRIQTVTPRKDGDWYVMEPVGRAGRYNVDLFAQGGGDMAATFRWTTPVDGEMPQPTARLALIAEQDGQAASYGIELMLDNLAETPRSAQAQITVTAANGRSLTFDAHRSGRVCWPEGTLYFDGPDAEGTAAAVLGDMPFHYEVAVTIDGEVYRASADYPADEIRGNEPSVALDFTPQLPALE